MAERNIHDCREAGKSIQNRSEESMDELNKVSNSPPVQLDIDLNKKALEPEIENTANEENASSSSPSIQRKFFFSPKLTITPDPIEQVASIISRKEYLAGLRGKTDNSICKSEATGSLMTQDKPDEKYRAAAFEITSIKIGRWQVDAKQQNDLVGKFYYSRKAIIWEFLAGRCKKKLEIKFYYIDAIKATMRKNEPGILQILLKESPDFYKEDLAQAGKKIIWEECSDFTGDEALLFRMHKVICPVGTLDSHYEKLLMSNSHLQELSRKPFPTDEYPMFINLRTTSQYNSLGRSRFNSLVVERPPHGRYVSIDPPPPGYWISRSGGANLITHIITVNAGEDVMMKVISFSQQGPQAICILSANGIISSVTLRQPSSTGGTLTYEGSFEILSLAGLYMPSETGWICDRSGGMSVSLASLSGQVLGGKVAGLLIAESLVQIVIGSFLAGNQQEPPNKKPKTHTIMAPMTNTDISMPTSETGDTYSGEAPHVITAPKSNITSS